MLKGKNMGYSFEESVVTVVVPRRVVEEEEVSSLQQWDKHGEFT